MSRNLIAHCPHCGNRSRQHYECKVGVTNGEAVCNTYFFKCITCGDALLYRISDWDGEPFPCDQEGDVIDLDRCTLEWPRAHTLHRSVPDSVRRCYDEAAVIKRRAPNAFANQIRRALEALCRDRGATGRVLANNLRTLAERGEIPQVLAEMTEVVRLFGNLGSHADGEEEVRPDDVDVIDDFFRTVIEYVYVAPGRLEQVRRRLEQSRAR